MRAWTCCLMMTLLALLTFGAGCGDGTDLDNFDVVIEDQTTLEGGGLLGELLGGFPALDGFTRFDLTQSQTFQNEGVDPDDVDSVVLDALVLRTIDPAGQDLSFLGEVVLIVEAEGLEPLEIARQDSFPAGVTEVSFDTSDQNLKRYVLAREATIRVEANDSRQPPQDTVVEFTATFDVDVRVF